MSKEDDLRDTLDKTAQEISHIQTNPRAWLIRLVYLLGQLEQEAVKLNPDKTAFNEMLSALMDEIRNYQRTGGW